MNNAANLAAAKRRLPVVPPTNLAQKAAQGAASLANKFGKATYDQPSKLAKPGVPKTPTQVIADTRVRKGRTVIR